MLRSCKKCQSIINKKNQFNGLNICTECGHIESRTKKLQSEEVFNVGLMFAIVCAILVVSMVYIKKWDTYAFTALPLTVKTALKVASAEDYLKLSKICEKRKNLSCVLDYSGRVLAKDSKNLEALFLKAHNLYRHKKYRQSLVAYNEYMENGGSSVGGFFEVGKLQMHFNMVKDSITTFEKAIDLKPDVLQITVLQYYIKALEIDGQYKKAIQTIEYVQDNARRSTKFMQTKLKDLESIASSQNQQNIKANKSSRTLTLPPKAQGTGA